MTTDKKAAIAAYKERKPEVGLFALRCATSGETWVGQTPNLATIQNRIWFTLRMGNHNNKVLQAAWAVGGENSLSFEVLELLENEDLAYIRDAKLKERHAHWLRTLTAKPV